MDEGQIKDLIAQLTVRVQATGKKEDATDITEKGTGVLLLQDNRAYVLTVYHCIYGVKEPFHTVTKNGIKFSFSLEVCSEPISPIEITPLKQNLVLMEIDISRLKRTDMKCHYLDRVYDGKQYYLRGFPKSEVHNFKATCNDKDFNEVTFKIDVDKLTDDTSGEKASEFIKGLSGSGVFFSENNQLYLVGLTNKLRNNYAQFNAVHCTKLVDLYNSDIKFSEFHTINDIVQRLKGIDKKISEDACKKFKDDNTYEYNNINRKHSNIYNKREVFSKNFEGIKHYLQGQNSINSIKLLDNNFENYLIEFISDTLSMIEPSITKYIDTKKEGRENLKLIRKETIDAIKDELNLIQEDTFISNKLREYIVIGWLLNCNVDFIVEEND
jgi:hypothetical protein